MIKIREGDLQYIYKGKTRKGVVLGIDTFQKIVELLEDYEDSLEFERLKDEDAVSYETYRRKRLTKAKKCLK